jgi:hypothetical protein
MNKWAQDSLNHLRFINNPWEKQKNVACIIKALRGDQKRIQAKFNFLNLLTTQKTVFISDPKPPSQVLRHAPVRCVSAPERIAPQTTSCAPPCQVRDLRAACFLGTRQPPDGYPSREQRRQSTAPQLSSPSPAPERGAWWVEEQNNEAPHGPLMWGSEQ